MGRLGARLRRGRAEMRFLPGNSRTRRTRNFQKSIRVRSVLVMVGAGYRKNGALVLTLERRGAHLQGKDEQDVILP